MRKLEPFLYAGESFDDNVCPICPRDPRHLPAIWAFVESGEFHTNVRTVDQALKVTAGTLTKVPFDLDHWQRAAAKSFPNGLPEPYSDDPTQWLFHGHPCGSVVWDALSAVRFKKAEVSIRERVYDSLSRLAAKDGGVRENTPIIEEAISNALREMLRSKALSVKEIGRASCRERV